RIPPDRENERWTPCQAENGVPSRWTSADRPHGFLNPSDGPHVQRGDGSAVARCAVFGISKTTLRKATRRFGRARSPDTALSISVHDVQQQREHNRNIRMGLSNPWEDSRGEPRRQDGGTAGEPECGAQSDGGAERQEREHGGETTGA